MQTLKDYGPMTKNAAFSVGNTNIDFGEISCAGNKDVLHTLKW
jgi:hypothetical protein